MEPGDSVSLPLWGVILISIVGPTLVYVYEKVYKPWLDKRSQTEESEHAREVAEKDKLRAALEEAIAEREELYEGRIKLLEGELGKRDTRIEQVLVLHQQCKDDTYNQGLLLARTAGKLDLLEDRLRSANERISGLSNENAELRRILVGQEKHA